MSAGSGVHPGLAAWHAYMAAGGEPHHKIASLDELAGLLAD